ncbi:MAG TPA: type I-U CRISPR-associated RAMP protein Csb1/Cas7u [Solirubrobacterales bacterium]|nr:type I-U CRISPR-associated RAMP protein Csb1/Cas7u [Solirubrobacterales bacterium]
MTVDLMSALREGVASEPSAARPAGIEIRQDLEPAGGLPVQPPSYEGRLEIHKRHIDGDEHLTVELDSVGSAANRIEEVLLDLHRAGQYPLPVSDTTVPLPDGDPVTITTLEAPHRLFDAWLRLSASEDGDGSFETSERGQELTRAHLGALDPILETSSHDLLFGAWDSHRKGPHGQLRIARALTSSLIGLDPVEQAQFAARRDPLNLGDGSESKGDKQAKRLSEQGLSSIPPQRRIPYEENEKGEARRFGGRVADHRGGVSITSARYLGYLSFPALRRLGFTRYDAVEVRVLLATLALYAVALRCAAGWDLRSRCTLLATGPLALSLVAADGTRESIELDLDGLRKLFEEQVAAVELEDRSVHLEAGAALEKLVAANMTAAA